MNKTNLLFYRKNAYKSAVLLLILFIPFTAIHEFGHVLFCSSGNYQVSIFPNGTTLCFGTIQNPTLYHAFGGVLASLVALVIAVLFRRFDFVLITFLSFGIAHGFNAIIETIQYQSYIQNSNIWTLLMAASNHMTFFGLLFIFGKRSIMWSEKQ